LGHVLVTVLLTLGCASGAFSGGLVPSVDSSTAIGTASPSALDEAPAAIGLSAPIRHRVRAARGRWCRAVRRVVGGDDRRRSAQWLSSLQIRLMPPMWRGPTVLRL
jgi:hypothetical protein